MRLCALETPVSSAFSAERTVLREPRVRCMQGAPDLEWASSGVHCRVMVMVMMMMVVVVMVLMVVLMVILIVMVVVIVMAIDMATATVM